MAKHAGHTGQKTSQGLLHLQQQAAVVAGVFVTLSMLGHHPCLHVACMY